MTQPRYTPEEDATIRRLWRDGLTIEQIGDAIGGRSVKAVSRRIRRMDLPKRGVGPSQAENRARDELIRSLWAKGAPHDEIAAAVGLARGGISYHITRLELPLRRPRDAAGPAPRKAGAALCVTVPGGAPAESIDAAPHPVWTPDLDAAVIRTGGAWSKLSALAARLRKPTAAVQQRWHRLRVA